jgi:hypothetical protein
MWTDYRLALAVTMFLLVAAQPAAAQQPPGQQDPVKQLQAKSVLTDEDQAALRGWVTQRVQVIAAAEAGNSGLSATAVSELRAAYTGAEGFKQAFGAACVRAIGSAYKTAGRDSGARLIAILNTFDQVSAYQVLIEALSDKRVPVRSAAAIGLANLRQKLAGAGGSVLSESLAALREAGKRETSSLALQHIYRALDYTTLSSPPDPKANAVALLALLEARGRQYGTGSVKAEGADRAGLDLAGKLAGQLSDEERRRLVVATAAMLRYGVSRYTSELYEVDDKTSSPLQAARRNQIELFITSAERLLVSLVNPPADRPVVTKEMEERAVDEKATYMKIQMNRWGDLLQQTYQIDVHMDVTEEPGADDEGGETPEP